MPRSVQISTRMRDTLETALDEYYEEINNTGLAPTSKRNYVSFAEQFVRWLNGEFVPGAGLTPRNEIADRRRQQSSQTNGRATTAG
jgi:hypothetical protein